MNNMYKKIFEIVASIILIITIVSFFGFKVNASSNNEVDKNTIDLQDISCSALYSATNTYNYNDNIDYDDFDIIPGEENNELYIMHSVSDKNNNQVSTEAPLLTVLTHGLGGGAYQWSNNGNDKLGYTDNSILASLFDLGNSNVYVANIKNNNYSLYNITEEIKGKINYINYTSLTPTSIQDISKHSIVIFDADRDTTNLENYKVYREFNYAISRVVYDIKLLNDNVLPRINLIGHSRGGLTNIEYALDHPDLVDTIFSMGTPYCGSSTASIDVALGCPIGQCPEGEEDLITQSKYMNYLNRWNDEYETLGYNNIKVYALGGYATLLFYQTMVWTEQGQNSLIDMTGSEFTAGLTAAAVDALCLAIEYTVLKNFDKFMTYDTQRRKTLIKVAVSESLANLDLSETCIDDIIQIIVSEINLDYHFPFVSWYNDGFVDLNSQLGLYGGAIVSSNGYKGFIRESFCFTSTNSDTGAYAMDALPIVHNLEPRDRRITNYIMKHISFSGKNSVDFEIYNISDTEVGIKSYIGKNISDTLVIPSYIDGKKVVEIGSFAFANNFNGEYIVTNVVIPNTIERIKKSAFENCSYLESINFVNESTLKYIDDSAFYGCSGITEIDVPDSVEIIGDYSFAYCVNLSNIFELPNNLKEFGKNVLLSTNISNINISNENAYFSTMNATLYNKTKSNLILSYTTGAFVVPDSVKVIFPYAFCNNVNITSIDLNNVEKIENYAFLNCSNLVNVYGGNNVEKANVQAFTSTQWVENNSLITLGSVLLKYNLETVDEYEVPENIKYIGEYAFETNELKNIYFKSNIEKISNYAFINCPNLLYIYILNDEQPVIYPNTFIQNTNLRIYVPSINEDEYKNNSLYSNYVNNISSKWISVQLYDGINLYKSTSIKYGAIIENFNELDKIGYDFLGWYCDINGELYKNGKIFDLCQENVELIAKYQVSKYKLYLNYNDVENNIDSLSINYGEIMEFPIPEKNGYTFVGWFDGPDSSYKKYSDSNGNAILSWDKDDDAVLYAVFENTQYQITYNLNGGTNSIYNPPSFYSDDVVILEKPTKYGYGFGGWTFNGAEIEVLEPGIYENVTLVANWIGKTIYTYSSKNEYVINGETSEHVIINLNNLSTANDVKFIIEDDVLQVTFVCTNSKEYNANIVVEERNLDLVINLSNVYFKAPNKCNALDAGYGEYVLYLNCVGENTLIGGNGINSEEFNGKNGCYGIKAYKLIIDGGTINVFGGNGYNGKDGKNGEDGANSVQYPDGSIFNPETGGNGGNGTNGENGESGGDGAFAIYTVSSFGYSNCNATFKGGDGGNGGNGGDGGNGGNGAKDNSGNPITGVGNPGKGGDGGNGGNGGNSGVGSIAVNSDDNIGIRGQDGLPGNGGLRGKKGEGGDAGSFGEDGEDGECGKVGNDANLIYTYYVKINCETDNKNNPLVINLDNQNSALIEITVQCSGYYNFETFSLNGSSLKLYDLNKNEITSIGNILVNDEKDILIFPLLSEGKYYLEVISNGNNESIDLYFDSNINHNRNISLNTPKDVLSHMHNGKENFTFYSPNGGFYYVKLISTSQYNTYYLDGTIKVLYQNELIEKFVLNNINNEASSILNSNILVFYAEAGRTYDIEITFNDYTIDTLTLFVNTFESIEIENNTDYYSEESMNYGDKFYLWSVISSGTYTFKLNYFGGCETNIPFYILKEENNDLFVLKTSFFSKYNSNRTLNITVEEGDKIYFGYLNGTSDGAIIINFEKYVSQTFEIITDANENVSVGSEVSMKEGSYGGKIITVGFTRICYLGNNAPDKTTRLNYEWKSSNEEIAVVSSYGTITAIKPGRVFITATYKLDNTIVGFIEIDVVPDYNNTIELLNYGFDVREGGTISGTEVTSGLGNSINVTNNPYVNIHKGYTRLICLGDDSPNSSVQAFNWTAYREFETDTGMVTVSQYGTITGTTSGWVTIKGTYKYNENYIVYIRIYVN